MFKPSIVKKATSIFVKATSWRQSARRWLETDAHGPINDKINNSQLELVSDRKVRDYYAREVPLLLSLGQVSPATINRIVENEVIRNRVSRKSTVFALLLGALVILVIELVKPSYKYAQYVDDLVLGAFGLCMVIERLRQNRRHRAEVATWELFLTIRTIEINEQHWNSLGLANRLIPRLESVAKAIESIPLQFKALSPSVRKEVALAGRRKAQAIRNLQRWVLTPGPLTYGDLLHRLTQDLCLVADGLWYELPEAEWARRKPLWIILAEVLAGIGLLVGGIVILEAFSKLGSIATVVATLFVGMASVVFTNSGLLSLGIVEGSVDVGSKLVGK